jgi:hypothetical protein
MTVVTACSRLARPGQAFRRQCNMMPSLSVLQLGCLLMTKQHK